MNIKDELISKIMESDAKHVSAFIAFLSLMKTGDSIITPVGKINKTGEDNFSIEVNEEVIEKGLETVFDEFRDPIERIFGHKERRTS